MKYISQNVKLFLKIWQVLEGKLLPLKESVGMIFFFIHIKLPSLFFFFSCWIYMCFISSHPVHHRRSCTSCPSSPRRTSCTSSPNTSAPRASRTRRDAAPPPWDRAPAASGRSSVGGYTSQTPTQTNTTNLRLCVCSKQEPAQHKNVKLKHRSSLADAALLRTRPDSWFPQQW